MEGNDASYAIQIVGLHTIFVVSIANITRFPHGIATVEASLVKTDTLVMFSVFGAVAVLKIVFVNEGSNQHNLSTVDRNASKY